MAARPGHRLPPRGVYGDTLACVCTYLQPCARACVHVHVCEHVRLCTHVHHRLTNTATLVNMCACAHACTCMHMRGSVPGKLGTPSPAAALGVIN